MGLKLPESLTADMPQTLWGKILSATPVVMTVIATMLAGLSSSEMTRAQYDRSLAAQQQSKAGDQWGYFQAKRLRGTALKTARDLLQCTSDVGQLQPTALGAATVAVSNGQHRCDAAARELRTVLTDTGTGSDAAAVEEYLKSSEERTAEIDKHAHELGQLLAREVATGAFDALCDGRVPELNSAPVGDSGLQAAFAAVEEGKGGKELEAILANVSHPALEEGLRAARERTRDFDSRIGPINRLSDQCDQLLNRQLLRVRETRLLARVAANVAPDADSRVHHAAAAASAAAAAVQADIGQLYRDFTAARLRYSATRYDAEARLNQVIANLYEVQVRKNNISAERHHTRSQRFFYGMLAAQMAVIMATFAMAARQRNLLWGLAAAAGVAAVTFAVYVYLYV